MKREYTKEQKADYFKTLRERWAVTKRISNEDEIKAVMMAHGISFSVRSYFFVAMQMKALGFDGIPYVDCKTFQGWKENGFMVKKGEKSQIDGITWISPGNGKEETEEVNNDYVFPRVYHLFHKTQVSELAA